MPDTLKRFHGRDLIFCDSSAAIRAHRKLFDFKQDAYIIEDNHASIISRLSDVISGCNSTEPDCCPAKLHIVMNWVNMLRLTHWAEKKPAVTELVLVFNKVGISSQELKPFLSGDIEDIFPWLYYSNKHEVLKKICYATKGTIESKIINPSTRTYCHLFYEPEGEIVSSSL
ncbi:MAG: hypothetical protein RBT37_09910 [Dissulfurispiraceae bacterium]|jgi:hypothetical protein|nr:hypothetical protein [Dissulfurispiraceae bacterium]